MKNYIKDDMKQIPWCFMPPEMHFESPEDIKEAITLFQKSRLYKGEIDGSMVKMLPPKDKFEKVKTKDGVYIMLPTALDYAFLFRGQGADYPHSYPTLFRKHKTKVELFIERMRVVEFELFLKQLPEVKFFEQKRFYIDYLGLAQHYGFQTEVMDLTSNMDVALFFAMTDLTDDRKTYIPKTEEKDYIGYIYCVPACQIKNNGDLTLFYGDCINAIGLQPFERPGAQNGFSIRLDEGLELKSYVYSFSYTKEDSVRIWEFFDKGQKLWKDDGLSKIARKIAVTKNFSYNAFNLCVKRYCNDRKDVNYRELLKKVGGTLTKTKNLSFLSNERNLLDKDFQSKNVEQEFLSKVVQRSTDASATMNLMQIGSDVLRRLIESGCQAPTGYETSDLYEISFDGKTMGMSMITPEAIVQTHPNPITGKIEKWRGNWREELKIDLMRKKIYEPRLVLVKK